MDNPLGTSTSCIIESFQWSLNFFKPIYLANREYRNLKSPLLLFIVYGINSTMRNYQKLD